MVVVVLSGGVLVVVVAAGAEASGVWAKAGAAIRAAATKAVLIRGSFIGSPYFLFCGCGGDASAIHDAVAACLKRTPLWH